MSYIGTWYTSMAAIAVTSIICASMLFSTEMYIPAAVILFIGTIFIIAIGSCTVTTRSTGGKS